MNNIWIGLLGVLIGAGIVLVSLVVVFKYIDRRQARLRELENRVKEIDTINLLNKKINEVLIKRNLYLGEYISFDAFDDCYITIDDFIYLQSFTAQNSFYLPMDLVEDFFNSISHHKVVVSPENTAKMGGYTYKGGRMIMETFSDNLVEIVKEKNDQLKKRVKKPLRYFGFQ